jgi:hypothetical protein
MKAGASGNGASLATISSTSALFFPRAESRTLRWFAGVRCGPSSLTVVRLTRPAASLSRMIGKRRAARATSMWL